MENVFPILPSPKNDKRFTIGLVVDVQDVLLAHGYPSDWTDADFMELQQALYRFLYAER